MTLPSGPILRTVFGTILQALLLLSGAKPPELRYQEEPGNEYNSPRNARGAHPRN